MGFPGRMTRQNTLIQTNLRWLRQALRLLARLDDTAYATTPAGLEPHRAGAHQGQVARMVAEAFLQLVGPIVLFVHHDQAGLGQGREHRRARTQHHARAAVALPVAGADGAVGDAGTGAVSADLAGVRTPLGAVRLEPTSAA